MSYADARPILAYEAIVDSALSSDRRVLIVGQPGIGKSTLATELGRGLWRIGRRAWCIGADPGSPAFGLPGAVCRGKWQSDDWALDQLEALCSLDAGRFRLPLVAAVRRLAKPDLGGPLLVDAPGVMRGVASAELLTELVEVAQIDLVLALARHGARPLVNELEALSVSTFTVEASPLARSASKQTRAQNRTRVWNRHLRNAREIRDACSRTVVPEERLAVE